MIWVLIVDDHAIVHTQIASGGVFISAGVLELLTLALGGTHTAMPRTLLFDSSSTDRFSKRFIMFLALSLKAGLECKPILLEWLKRVVSNNMAVWC